MRPQKRAMMRETWIGLVALGGIASMWAAASAYQHSELSAGWAITSVAQNATSVFAIWAIGYVDRLGDQRVAIWRGAYCEAVDALRDARDLISRLTMRSSANSQTQSKEDA